VSATPDEAAARHAALFGAKPLHPGPGQWTWKDGRLGSSAYGTPTSWREPPYRPELGDFGLFEGVSRLSVNMQFDGPGYVLSRGSRTSRRPSPRRFIASTVSMMASPGKVEIHQASRR
jgi:hypothetical protein